MGLDIYAGSLTRYYAGDWELVTQQAAREMGLEIQVLRQHDPPDQIRDRDQIRAMVLAWRDNLSASLTEHLAEPLDWDEGEEAPYFTDKPSWDCYSDLLLWAAYDEQQHLRRPVQHVDDWSQDSAYRLGTQLGVRSSYTHLWDVELWLPCKFGFVFQTDDVNGNEVLVGSSRMLIEQLQSLNDRTWRVDSDTLRQWRREGADHGASLEVGARFAFALIFELATEAVEHRLPMRLDW